VRLEKKVNSVEATISWRLSARGSVAENELDDFSQRNEAI